MAEREFHGPLGLEGGGEGGRTEVLLNHNGRTQRISSKCTLSLSAVAVVAAPAADPIAELKMRLVRGEITEDQYNRMLSILKGS